MIQKIHYIRLDMGCLTDNHIRVPLKNPVRGSDTMASPIVLESLVVINSFMMFVDQQGLPLTKEQNKRVKENLKPKGIPFNILADAVGDIHGFVNNTRPSNPRTPTTIAKLIM